MLEAKSAQRQESQWFGRGAAPRVRAAKNSEFGEGKL